MTGEEMSTDPVGVDGMPLLDDQPIDFSKVACSIDGVPMVNLFDAQLCMLCSWKITLSLGL